MPARLAATQRWLHEIVIAGKLCPFAAPVRSAPRLRLKALDSLCEDTLVADVAHEVRLVASGAAQGVVNGRLPDGSACTIPETSLLVMHREAAPSWMDLVRLSWRLQSEAIEEQGFSADLQLVLFHPRAVHSTYGEGPPDAADYSIRAPFPTVHLLREMDVLAGIKSYRGAAQIPDANRVRLRGQGLEACAQRLAACGRPTHRGAERE